VDEGLLAYYIISVTEAAFQRTCLDGAKSPEEIFAFFFDAVYNGLAPQRHG
jgi:hypothetical protein